MTTRNSCRTVLLLTALSILDVRQGVAAISQSATSRIVYGDACGYQGSGRFAYVQNTTRSRAVASTVRESYSSGRDRWNRTQTFNLEPGGSQWVGCTRGDTAVEWKSFSIVGSRLR